MSDERIEYLKFFLLWKEIETCNEEFLPSSFFLCSVLKIFILLLKERESNVLLFFLSILSRCWKRKWNPKKKNHPIQLRNVAFLFYPREIILTRFTANLYQIHDPYLNLIPFKFLTRSHQLTTRNVHLHPFEQ